MFPPLPSSNGSKFSVLRSTDLDLVWALLLSNPFLRRLILRTRRLVRSCRGNLLFRCSWRVYSKNMPFSGHNTRQIGKLVFLLKIFTDAVMQLYSKTANG